jgi:hypothetical protein
VINTLKNMEKAKNNLIFLVNIIADIVIIGIMNARQNQVMDLMVAYSQIELLIAFGVCLIQIIWFFSKYLEYFNSYTILRYIGLDRICYKIIIKCIFISFFFTLLINMFFLGYSILKGYSIELDSLFYIMSNVVLQFMSFLAVLLLMTLFYVKSFYRRRAVLQTLVVYFLLDLAFPDFRYYFVILPQATQELAIRVPIVLCINIVLVFLILNLKKGEMIFED